MERDAFLARVRSAGSRAVLPAHPVSDPGLLVPDLPHVELVEAFTSRSEEVEALVHPVDDIDVPHTVLELVRGYAARSFLAWDEQQLPVTGIADVLRADGLEQVPGEVTTDERLTHQMGYLALDVGITGAEAGLAESGSIVLRSGPGRPRMASAIPLIHVVILRRERIFRSLAHWAASEASTIAEAANVILVTGPSRTADIEQHINIGVHGPRYVHVILV